MGTPIVMDSNHPEDVIDQLEEKLDNVEDSRSLQFTDIETQILEERAVKAATDPNSPVDSMTIVKFHLSRLVIEILEEYDNIVDEVNKDIDKSEQFEMLAQDIEGDIDEREFNDAFEEAKDQAIRANVRIELLDEVLLFFVLASGIIEKLTKEAFEERLIADEFKDTKNTSILINQKLTQERREGLLLRTGKISKDILDEIRRVISIRNELVHNIESQQLLDSTHLSDINSDIIRSVNAINNLHKEVRDTDFISA